MVISKTKRYILFLMAFILESLVCIAYFKVLSFPILTPILIFCEVVFYMEISNILVLMLMSTLADFLMADFLGRYLIVISIFLFLSLLLRRTMIYMSSKKFWVTYVAFFAASHLIAAGFFVLARYGVFSVSIFVFSILTSLFMLPLILALYSYSLSKRVFIEGRYVKR